MERAMRAHDIDVFADYFQFYLFDAGAETEVPEKYDDGDIKRMVKTWGGVLVIMPVRNMTVPVRVEIHDEDPGVNLEEWDHVADCSLSLPTGALEVQECTGTARLELQVPPGVYEVRALFGGLLTLSENGLRGDDRYCVQLWSGQHRPLRIVKQGSSNRAGT
jgi:hypothetical protein